MEDHRAISITLTSILEQSPPLLPKVVSGTDQCLDLFYSFSVHAFSSSYR